MAGRRGENVSHIEARRDVVRICKKMEASGISQGVSGSVSCRVPGGFVVTPCGTPFDKLQAEQIAFMDAHGGYYGDFTPTNEWRVHLDIYKYHPEAKAIIHAHPTYCTALACRRRGIPSFHYMVAISGAKQIKCAEYAPFGTEELSNKVLSALRGDHRSILLANHGMLCHGPNLDKALWLAGETEVLAKQYISALSTGIPPEILPDNEMQIMLAKFKTYGKQAWELAALTDFERMHAITAPTHKGGNVHHPSASDINVGERYTFLQTTPQYYPVECKQGEVVIVSEVYDSEWARVQWSSGYLHYVKYNDLQIKVRSVQAGPDAGHLAERQKVIQTCLKMNEIGINQGTSGNISCRVPGGFVVTATGVPYDNMKPEHVVFMDLNGNYYGDKLPSSEWRMHYDIYKNFPEAKAVLHAHPIYSTALSCQRRKIPAFHYMVAAAGGKEISCADYSTFGTQELSDGMVSALGDRRSCLLANHGMICYGSDLDDVLWLANETECLARQYLSALSTGTDPAVLTDEEMKVTLAKFKSQGKKAHELSQLSEFERTHVIKAPRWCGADSKVPASAETPIENGWIDVAPAQILQEPIATPASSLSGLEDETLLQQQRHMQQQLLQQQNQERHHRELQQAVQKQLAAVASNSKTAENAPTLLQNQRTSAASSQPTSIVRAPWFDAATLSILGHGLSTLALAFRMSLMNVEQTRFARSAGKNGAKRAAQQFLNSDYYRSWSRAQLNNTEYAPMLSLLCLCLKLKANRNARTLNFSESASCLSSLVFSLIFVSSMTSRHAGSLRPVGALGRYAAQAWMLLELVLRQS